MKEVRYHHLIEKLLSDVPAMKIIGIVRHPCGVINSWLQAPKEFHPEWDPLEEWRFAPKKNQGRIEEFNGFEKWKEVARKFVRLEQMQPTRFCLVQYEHLVRFPHAQIEELLAFVGLGMDSQITSFIKASQQSHHDDPYSVFKHPLVVDKWQQELPKQIAHEILCEAQHSELERFLT
jgi:hypothetical protein